MVSFFSADIYTNSYRSYRCDNGKFCICLPIFLTKLYNSREFYLSCGNDCYFVYDQHSYNKTEKWQEIKAEGERERMRANLLRAVSHDLRTPLTTIYGSSSAILDNYDSLRDGQKKRMIEGITDDSEWLIRMVENLLSLTRIDGNVKLIKSPTVLDELVDSAILKFKKRYPSADVKIDLPDQMLIIPMDPMLIEQVIINLFENAVKHATGMTRISLRVLSVDNRVVFEVSDDGCGIEKDRLAAIFSGYDTASSQPSDAKRNAG